MPYEFINRDCADNDFTAALANFTHAEWRLQQLRPIWQSGAVTPTERLEHLRVYQLCRGRVLDIGQYVNGSFGRPMPPERPDWCTDPDTLAAT